MSTFVISAAAFSHALEQVVSVVPQNPLVSASGCVLLVGRGTPAGAGATLYLLCTNLETRLTTTVPFECAENFAICIEAGLLARTVKGFPDAPITGRVDADTFALHLSVGKSKYQLVGEPAEGFPKVAPPANDARELRLPANVLHRALSATLATANTVTNVASAFTNAILVETTNQYAAFVSTTTTRLGAFTLDSDDDRTAGAVHWGADYIRSLIPRSAAVYLHKALNPKSPADVTLLFEKDTVRLADSRWLSRLMDVEFPAYRGVFPLNFAQTLTVEHSEFVAALRRLAPYTDHGDAVAMHVDLDGSVILRADNPMAGHHGEEHLESESGFDEPLSIGFPAAQLLSLLGLWVGGRIQLGLNGPQRPVIITQVGDSADFGLACMISPTAVVRPIEAEAA